MNLMKTVDQCPPEFIENDSFRANMTTTTELPIELRAVLPVLQVTVDKN